MASFQGTEFTVNATTANNQYSPAAAAFANGNYIVTWVDLSQNDSAEIRAQMFNAAGGKIGAEQTVNTTTLGFQTAPAVCRASRRWLCRHLDRCQRNLT